MRSDASARVAGLLLALHAACFWPVWCWYVERLTDGSDEPWVIVALLAAVALSWPRAGFRLDAADPLLAAAAALTLLYAVLVPFAPPLIRQLTAMVALGASWVAVTGTRARLAPILALLALSIPVIASLQFYAGFPLRVLTASGATCVLNLFGLDVARVGTSMSAAGRTVLVDAPCSGVRMLWTGAMLTCVLAAMRARVGWRALALSLFIALPVVLAANSLRAALLFVAETRAGQPSGLAHSLIGMFTFLFAAGLLLASELLQMRYVRRGPAMTPVFARGLSP